MLFLLPNELQLCVYQDWIADIHDLSALDIACCNQAMRKPYISSLCGICIDFDYGTSPYAERMAIHSYLKWISHRQVRLEMLALTVNAMQSLLSGPVHAQSISIYLPENIGWTKAVTYDKMQIFQANFSQFVSLVSIDLCQSTLSDRWMQMLADALAGCQMLRKVILRYMKPQADVELLSFLCSHKDTLKELELGAIRPRVLQELDACHALETVTLRCYQLDRTSVLDFCRHHPRLQVLCITNGSGFDDSFVQEVLMTCPQVHTLSVGLSKCYLTADILNGILNKYIKLKHLCVDNIAISIRCEGRIRSCGIKVNKNILVGSIIAQLQLPIHAFEVIVQTIEDSTLVRLVGDRAGGALHSLGHSSCTGEEHYSTIYHDLMYTLQRCPNIQDLDMSCHTFDFDQVISILASLPHLRKLSLCDLSELDDASKWLNMVKELGHHPLHSLHFTKCFSTSDDIILEIGRLLPGLQILEFSYCIVGTDLSTVVSITTLHLLPGTLLLVDTPMMDQLVEISHSNVLLKKEIKKGTVQDGYSWRTQHPTTL